jgi:putative redox protein
MVEVTTIYEGQLHCRVTHGPSGAQLLTDAPVDNMGKGESFSPTDLVAAALGTCILTIIGIIGRRHNLSVEGASCTVSKEMINTPVRRIGRLVSHVYMPVKLSEDDRRRMENAAHTCPVEKSLHPSIETPIIFHWGSERGAGGAAGA